VGAGGYPTVGGLLDAITLKSQSPGLCIDTMTVLPNPNPNVPCPIPTLTCVKLLNNVPETPTTGTTCVKITEVSGAVSLSQPGQKVVLSGCPQACDAPYIDDIGVVTVTAPSGNVIGSNYCGAQSDCQVAGLPLVTLPTTHALPIDITSLFGGEVGTFTVNIKVFNKYTPTSYTDVYICTGQLTSTAQLTEASTLNDNIDSKSKVVNGDSSMPVLIAVLCSVGACTLIFGIILFAIVKKGQVKFGSGLTEQLQ